MASAAAIESGLCRHHESSLPSPHRGTSNAFSRPQGPHTEVPGGWGVGLGWVWVGVCVCVGVGAVVRA